MAAPVALLTLGTIGDRKTLEQRKCWIGLLRPPRCPAEYVEKEVDTFVGESKESLWLQLQKLGENFSVLVLRKYTYIPSGQENVLSGH